MNRSARFRLLFFAGAAAFLIALRLFVDTKHWSVAQGHKAALLAGLTVIYWLIIATWSWKSRKRSVNG